MSLKIMDYSLLIGVHYRSRAGEGDNFNDFVTIPGSGEAIGAGVGLGTPSSASTVDRRLSDGCVV
jgi:hypothetical protein